MQRLPAAGLARVLSLAPQDEATESIAQRAAAAADRAAGDVEMVPLDGEGRRLPPGSERPSTSGRGPGAASSDSRPAPAAGQQPGGKSGGKNSLERVLDEADSAPGRSVKWTERSTTKDLQQKQFGPGTRDSVPEKQGSVDLKVGDRKSEEEHKDADAPSSATSHDQRQQQQDQQQGQRQGTNGAQRDDVHILPYRTDSDAELPGSAFAEMNATGKYARMAPPDEEEEAMANPEMLYPAGRQPD